MKLANLLTLGQAANRGFCSALVISEILGTVKGVQRRGIRA